MTKQMSYCPRCCENYSVDGVARVKICPKCREKDSIKNDICLEKVWLGDCICWYDGKEKDLAVCIESKAVAWKRFMDGKISDHDQCRKCGLTEKCTPHGFFIMPKTSRIKIKKCAGCGKDIRGKRSDKRWCSSCFAKRCVEKNLKK